MTYRLVHNGIYMAVDHMTRALLVPTRVNSRAILKSIESRDENRTLQASDVLWVNRNLHDEQKQAILEVLTGCTDRFHT